MRASIHPPAKPLSKVATTNKAAIKPALLLLLSLLKGGFGIFGNDGMVKLIVRRKGLRILDTLKGCNFSFGVIESLPFFFSAIPITPLF
jgi:hypothetical protein